VGGGGFCVWGVVGGVLVREVDIASRNTRPTPDTQTDAVPFREGSTEKSESSSWGLPSDVWKASGGKSKKKEGG